MKTLMVNRLKFMIVLLFVATNGFGQEFEKLHSTVKKTYKVMFDSLAAEIDTRPDFGICRDTTPIYEINDVEKVVGLFIARYYRFPNSPLAKIETYGYKRPFVTFYYMDSLLFKTLTVGEDGAKTVYYYTEEINKESANVHHRISILYPDSKEYWNNLAVGKSYFLDPWCQ